MTAPSGLPGAGIVTLIGGLNVAAAAPVTCTFTAAAVEIRLKPAGGGTPLVPERVGVESAGAVKVSDGGAVSCFRVPSAFFAVITVLGGNDAVTAARYPVVSGAVATVVVLALVVAVPFALTTAPLIGTFVEGLV